jgi:gluconokinase
MSLRAGHFMKSKMLDSQLATLEDPKKEMDVGVIELADPTAKQVADGAAWVRRTLHARL